ncbi:NHLP family bacteriocin export ABC transporter peptidase/permease/ATPase subunit [soil metagenome]
MKRRVRQPSKHRVHTPSVLQMEVAECGAAALGMVLAYFGRRVPLEELRIVCGVSRDGSKAGNVVRGARSYGLEAVGMRREVDEVLSGSFPVIVFWNFNHFVVVDGATRGKVFLNDPAMGPRSVTREEFAKSFTGVSLEFEPGPGFEPGGAASGLLARLGQRLSGLKTSIALVAWISLMLVLPGLVMPGLTAVFIDNILVWQSEGWLSPMLVAVGLTFLVNIVLRALQEQALLRIEIRLALEQSARFAWHVLSLPVAFFSQRYTGDLVDRVGANDRVATLLAGDFGNAAANGLTAAFLGVVMISYDGLLGAIALGGALLNIGVLRLLNRSLADVALRLQIERGKLFSTSVVGLQSIETLKATGGEDDFFAKWAGYHARAINSEQKMGVYQQVIDLLPPVLLSLTSAAVLGFGALEVVEGSLTVGMLVAFQGLLVSFSGPVQQMVGVAGRVQQASADLARLDDVLHYPKDWRFSETPTAPAEARATGRLSLSDVSFGYSPLEPPLIENFSLDVAPGQWVALVGESGSGKSTMGKLITGLLEARSGQVRIDGYSLGEWGRERLATIVSSVDQDIRLFQGSVHDNVTLWDETVPHSRLVAAIDDVGLTQTISSMPGSFHGLIEEGGRNLNGGQRQRIEIARALLRQPAILVLDEATSALDAVSEGDILDAVRRRGMTCVLVAHRLSTIRDCDEIIVLERGKVVERGTHPSLMKAQGAYARLIGAEVTS